MGKKEIKKLLREKRSTLQSLGDKAIVTNDYEELRKISDQMTMLRNEMNDLEDQLDEIDEEEERNVDPNIASMSPVNDPIARGAQPIGPLNILGTYGIGCSARSSNSKQGGSLVNNEEYEKRGQDLKEKRTVTFDMKELAELRATTISSGSLVIPTQTSDTLNPAFNQVSTLIDLVKTVPLQGGEAYKKGFVVGYGEGGETAENADYTDTDPIMDYVTIGKSKITAYCEMSEEAGKLPNVAYQAEVANGINIALRKKISKQILIGAGGENQIKGIFKAPENVIPVASDLSISAINEGTLDKIVFAYGGDEDLEGDCYLILNKKDLAAFASIRATDGKKLYKITFDGNTGTISSDDSYSVKFIINSACPALSVAETTGNTYCMAYGKILGYEMPIFSPVEVQESRDYKFKSGQVCYKGSVYVGGSVAMYKGFTRIKKAAV